MLATSNTLACLEERGYTVTLEGGRLRIQGPAAPPPHLEKLLMDSRDALKAAVLLADPPAWLSKLFNLYWSGHETPVRRSGPSGKAEVYLVSVSIKNIVAAVGVELGIPQTRWSEIHPEVEEALGTWEGAA